MPNKDTSVAIKQSITSALSATQGHKRSYPTSYYIAALNATKRHTYWLSIKPLIKLYPIYTELRSQPKFSMGVQLLYTVIKAEF